MEAATFPGCECDSNYVNFSAEHMVPMVNKQMDAGYSEFLILILLVLMLVWILALFWVLAISTCLPVFMILMTDRLRGRCCCANDDSESEHGEWENVGIEHDQDDSESERGERENVGIENDEIPPPNDMLVKVPIPSMDLIKYHFIRIYSADPDSPQHPLFNASKAPIYMNVDEL